MGDVEGTCVDLAIMSASSASQQCVVWSGLRRLMDRLGSRLFCVPLFCCTTTLG